jgi:hypothetical protein
MYWKSQNKFIYNTRRPIPIEELLLDGDITPILTMPIVKMTRLVDSQGLRPDIQTRSLSTWNSFLP